MTMAAAAVEFALAIYPTTIWFELPGNIAEGKLEEDTVGRLFLGVCWEA